jgi:hypothetical protein
MELSQKTTILLSAAQHQRLVSLARQRGVSMGHLIRTAVEAQYGADDVQSRLDAVAELAALNLPVGTPAQMKAESIPVAVPPPR